MSLKVMFIYPNHKGMNMLPPAIGLLSAILKKNGYQVRLFDTTYYNSIDGSDSDSDKSKSDRLMARPYKMPNEVTVKYTDCYEDFLKECEEFQPDLLALSSTEDMWDTGVKLLRKVRTKHKILSIAGGVFPTFAPELALSFPEVDIVCKGEGEDALLELCKRLESNKPYHDINNLWVKKKNGVVVSNPTTMCDMDANPLIDMSLFEEARYYRPMGGQVYRMFPVETHRGCAFRCAFCNSPSQMDLYKAAENKSYLRRKSFKNMARELSFYKNEMKAEYLYFWADTFFSWHGNEFDEFCEIYEDIKLPFWCQTRVETVNRERLEKLQKMGCARVSFGLEHGDEVFRRERLDRRMSNSMLIRNLKLVHDIGIPFSVNNIMGFPTETRDLAFQTIELNRQFYADDRNAYSFTPFHGTPLRTLCEKLGLVEPDRIVKSMVTQSGWQLDMPQFGREEVYNLTKTFNMYVRFPKSRWPEIKIAEKNDDEGIRMYEKLKEEFVSEFWDKSRNVSFEQSAADIDPMAGV